MASVPAHARLPKGWPATLRSWVGGRWWSGAGAPAHHRVPCVHAASGEQYCDLDAAGEAEVDAAVTCAAAAQKAWAARAPAERGRVLRRAAQLLAERNDELALLETLDTSKPVQETMAVDVVSARDCFEYYGGIASSGLGEYIAQPNRSFAYTMREPLGVTAGICAWNYPLQGAAWKAAPALACGNAILVKPAEDTPLTALRLGELLKEAGLPDGLYNVLLGGAKTGELLTKHAGVRKVSFTGSVRTGVSISRSAAETLKRVQMELGGKSPLIVFEDADIDQAVSAAMLANWYSSGQVCSNGTRVFVQRTVKDAFLGQLVARTRKLRIGDPFDPATQIGPLVSKKHLDGVMNYVELGRREGARLLCGGERLVTGPHARGAYMSPAIFDDCHDGMRIVKEEIFGPVATILPFDTEEEAVRRANATEYGLSAGVFTKDIQRAHRVVRDIDAGTTWINNYNLAPAELPWTGHKLSGVGASNGTYGIEDWTQVKSVYVEMDKVYCPYE